jgi:hypothetical protein
LCTSFAYRDKKVVGDILCVFRAPLQIMYFKSALPSSSGGVPTEINRTSESTKAAAMSVVKLNRPFSCFW